MKRLLICLTLIILLIPVSLFAQGGPKLSKEVVTGPMPRDGFVLGQPTSTMVKASYVPSWSFLAGVQGDYNDLGAGNTNISVMVGVVKPTASPHAYIMASGEYGKLDENDEYQMSLRGMYFLTSGLKAFNFGVIGGLGPLFEKLASGPSNEDYIAYLLTTFGVVATYAESGNIGFWGTAELQTSEDYQTARVAVGTSLMF